MAVNPQKLLPPAKLTTAERMSAAYDKKIDDLLNLKIKKKLINVDKVVSTTKKVKEKTKKQKKVRKETEKRDEKETKLEQKKVSKDTKVNLPGLPKTGIFTTIENFLGYTFLGYVFTNYSNNLPALTNVVKMLPSAMNTFGSIIKGTVDITAGIIEGGYKFRNDLSQKVNELGGKNTQKTFDTFTNNFKDMINSIMTLGLYKPQPVPQKYTGGYVRKMAPGGNVKAPSVADPISREIQKVKVTTPPPVVFKQTTDPGKDIGGRKKIEAIFPSSPKRSDPGPLNTLMSTSKTLGEVPFIGPLMAAAVDIAMGQKPDKRVYQTFGESLSHLIGPTIEDQSNLAVNNVVSTIAAMAGGGISRQILKKTTSREEVAVALGKLFETSVEGRLAKIFSEILKTKPVEKELPPIPGAIKVDSSSPDFWLLAVASMLENSDPQGAADVAQVIYNRIASPSWPNSIRSVIMSGNGAQFQPVRDYGTIEAWNSIKDKESAVDFIKRYGRGRTQSQLEQVAGALLDPNRQRSAANFVGPRDSFRAIAFEEANNHLADDTEQRRHGHAFGFEPGGAQIGAFRAGKLQPAQVSPATTGTITSLSTPLTGENGRLKPSQLTKVGTLYGGASYQDWYGNGAYLRHDAAKAFLAAKAQAEKEGVTILITSAYRSLAHQQALQGIYDVVAAPGTSRHGEGTALDIQTGTRGYNWFVQNGPTYGWYYMAIPNDPVHFEYLGTRRSSMQSRSVSAAPTLRPPTAEVASAQPKIMDTARQLAMTPAYAEQGGGTTFILKEKILLKEVPAQNSAPMAKVSNIDFPGVNSSTPTFIG